ncbi:hypothetical protein E1287_37220 [Actinomadura sp. KC06]|uniref:hypothetical protein n=1 Tax=Actinomadura sp. KC06 TaxID=2530369 RepID=UPI001050667C|nr:hypothetical protein [Actinomadura sp. KC06]TDD25432.1 hypothetical protein E1287_37220 [Actinomadura sp. KC06]
MAQRLLPIVLLSTAAATACGGGGERARPVHGTAPAEIAGVGYTADELRQALLVHVPGYRRASEPDAGEYGTLKAVQNAARLQRDTVLDKPQCGTSRPGGTVDTDVPAALVTFAKKGMTVTETLMGMPAADAEKQVNARVPPDCLTFRTRVGSHRADHRVVETPKGEIGEGSRTVGVATVSGAAHTRTWYVVFRGRHYLATITLYGPTATRAEAERLARASRAHATKILP